MSRMDRINQLIKEEMGVLIQREIADPRLKFITVTQVRVSKDLRNAVVLYSFYGESRHMDLAQSVLERSAGYLRRLLGQRIQLRFLPHLRFEYDPRVRELERLERVFEEMKPREESSSSAQAGQHEAESDEQASNE